MSFNMSDRRVASEARTGLADQVALAKKQSPKEEHAMVEASAQIIDYNLQGVDDEHLVEYNASGGSTPSTGEKYFNVTLSARAIRTKATTAEEVKPWTPDQGPLAIKTASEPLPMINAGPNADPVA